MWLSFFFFFYFYLGTFFARPFLASHSSGSTMNFLPSCQWVILVGFCGYHNYRIPCYTQLQRVDFIHFHILNYRRPCCSQLQCVDFIHFHILNYRRPCYSQLQHVGFIHFHIPNYRRPCYSQLHRVDFIPRPGTVNAEMKVPSKVFSCR